MITHGIDKVICDRVVAVVALALVPGGRRGRRDGPTDLCTGAGVLGDAVVAPVARQVGDQAHVVLAAGFHTAGIPRARRGQSAASRPPGSPAQSVSQPHRVSGCHALTCGNVSAWHTNGPALSWPNVASPPMPPRVTVVVAPGSERRAVSGLEPEGRHAPFVPGASQRPDA
jgi:hypothetical protein